MWQQLISLCLPTKRNHYQAVIAQPLVWSSLILSLLIVNAGWYWNHNQFQMVKGDTTDLSASQIITLTNQARLNHQLSSLTENAKLTQAAFAKAQNMISTGNFNHSYQTNQGAINPWEFITATGYQYYYAGENLARNFSSSQDLIAAWLNSPEHADNLLSTNYQEIGVAVVEGAFPNQPHTTLVVQLLASPQPAGTIDQTSLNQANNFHATSLLSAPDQTFHLPLNYPLVLALITVSILITTALVLLVDLTYAKTKRQHLPRHLWHH